MNKGISQQKGTEIHCNACRNIFTVKLWKISANSVIVETLKLLRAELKESKELLPSRLYMRKYLD